MTSARLIAICGPMFSGKTTELIRRLSLAASQGVPVVVIKPALDNRYADVEVVSHAGDRLPAVPVPSVDHIEPVIGASRLVGIDEAHFFGAGLTPICVRLLARGVGIIVAGLERDHYGEPFEPFPTLLCEADEVLKLAGPCAVCGGPAIHSQRMIATPGRIVVGGAEAYQPRCRACFRPAPRLRS